MILRRQKMILEDLEKCYLKQKFLAQAERRCRLSEWKEKVEKILGALKNND